MEQVTIPQVAGGPIDPALFGGNFLADRYPLGTGSGTEEAIDRLGVNGLRYPGGSLTERLFDIRTPDAPRVENDDGSVRDFVPLSDFLDYAAANDHAVTIVIPTRDNLSNRTDPAGDRFPAFDEEDLRDFVRDVAMGRYGDAEIAAFEIGNEYWGSGEMTAVEYGRLASRMADIVDDELTSVALETGTDPGIDIIVQAGTNNAFSNLSQQYEDLSVEDTLDALNDRFGTDLGEEVVFFGGRINWRAVNDELVLREFSADERDGVDGVVTHIYSKESVSPGQRDFGLRQIERSWEEDFPGIDIHVTEWNKSAADPRLKDDEDFGLYQAKEILDVFESMVSAGVEQAHVWPLLQNTRNALSPDAADGGLSPAGEMFSMMANALPGKSMLDFAVSDDRTTEFQGTKADLHGFYGEGEMVLYLASTSARVETLSMDLSQLVDGPASVDATLLGVRDGDRPGAVDADAVTDRLAGEDVFDDGRLVATLAPGEILQVRLTDFAPTEDLRAAIALQDAPLPDLAPLPDPVPEIPDVDTAPVPLLPAPLMADEPDQDEDEDQPEDDGDDIWDALGWLLMLAPILALGGLRLGG